MSRLLYTGPAFGVFRLESEYDLCRQRAGTLPAPAVRTVWLDAVEVRSGRMLLGLPRAAIQSLGLYGRACHWRGVRVYDPVRLTVLDRDMLLEVDEVEDGRPALVGQIPLEHMQMVVDMANHRVTKSPANGGEWVLDMF